MTTSLLHSPPPVGSRSGLRRSTLRSSSQPPIHPVHGLRHPGIVATIQITHKLPTFVPHTAEMEIAWSKVASLPACLPAKASR